MATGIDLSPFWELLESNFPPAGPRCDLRDLLGRDLVAALEAGEHVSYLRVADTVACPHPGGSGCPRQVIERADGTYHAVCGNNPPECDDVDLALEDVEVLGVDPERLCRALRRPLCSGGKVEPIAGLRNVYRAGAFKPDPSTRHAVYFIARCDAREYREALDGLQSRHNGSSFAVLVPTDRFINSEIVRQMAMLGVPIVPLRGTVDIDVDGELVTDADPRRIFADIGRRTSMASKLIVAEVLTHEGWRELDESDYRRLLEAADEYDILADEKSRSVWKREDDRKRTRRSDGIQAGYFSMIRAAVEKTGYFDPAVDAPDEDQVSGKQIFQRARKSIDVKYKAEDGGTQWRLFKTVTVDKHAEYCFEPDPECRFALIFLPRS